MIIKIIYCLLLNNHPRSILQEISEKDMIELFGINEDDVDIIFMAKEQIELGN